MAVSLAKNTFVATLTFDSGEKVRKTFTDRQVAWDWCNENFESAPEGSENPCNHARVTP